MLLKLSDADIPAFVQKEFTELYKFPEDLPFQETVNQESFQGCYVTRYPFKGELKCSAAQSYEGKFYPLVAQFVELDQKIG